MSIAESLTAVRERIAAACARGGRDPAGVRIVAVSKTQPASAVVEAIAAGADAIGENRVQEAASKRPVVSAATPWHLIGPLQRNKAKLALEVFDVIETVDRPELADRLEGLLAPVGRTLPVLVEVNVGGETQKTGVAPGDARRLVEHVLARTPRLSLRGLMTVPPYDPDPERSRPAFAALRRLARELEAQLGLDPLELSMGMSEDFEVAVEEGATIVRLGRVLFGERRSTP
ncbi:MAG TPA: YggS family pyridoxal phosphate-dependent enzyme [Thermoanaerobaculaceae bacterium]|nr:YggS family pyridoxal phosphate-dependent enzyme [Thermoanaerobaculaceae bacterium]